jgi:hypothetical protein
MNPMFEEELKLERRSSNVLPLLLILSLLAVVVGTVVYTILEVKEGKKAPTSQDASRLAAGVLAARRPAVTEFRTGTVKPRPNDTVSEPNYRLLEKAGLVKVRKDKSGAGAVTLTPQGEQALAAVPGVKQAKNKDGSVTYTVPLAERKLLQVTAVVVEHPNVARVDYTWQWAPNQFGDLFDATGAAAMSLDMWGRSSLIQKHGSDLFHDKPAKESVRVLHTDKGWIVASE